MNKYTLLSIFKNITIRFIFFISNSFFWLFYSTAFCKLFAKCSCYDQIVISSIYKKFFGYILKILNYGLEIEFYKQHCLK